MLLGGVIWTFWMAVGLALGTVAATAAVVVGYFRSVVRPKYPPRDSRRS